LQAGGVGVRLVERSLRGMNLVARPVMARAHLLELPLGLSQPRRFRFQLDTEALDLAPVARALRGSLLAASQPQQALGGGETVLQLVVTASDLRLRRKV